MVDGATFKGMVNVKLVQFGEMDLNVLTCKKKWYHIVGGMFLLRKKGDMEQALQGIGQNLDNQRWAMKMFKRNLKGLFES